MENLKTQSVIDALKKKATDFAKDHATRNAKNFYVLGKKDAATSILGMIKEDGISAIVDVAQELIKHDPEHQIAKWIIENKHEYTRGH